MKLTNMKRELVPRAQGCCLLASGEAGPYCSILCLLRLMGLGVLGKSRQLTSKSLLATCSVCLSSMSAKPSPNCLHSLPSVTWSCELCSAMSAHTCHDGPWLFSRGAVIVLLGPVWSFHMPLLLRLSVFSVFTIGEFLQNSPLLFCS